ncbi:MAG TPA: hypothetical protein VFV38_49670 [Ktedonobacteraceae bacterium]|nr:hypothetical protein [Ktedonobacteraceae bacterium]
MKFLTSIVGRKLPTDLTALALDLLVVDANNELIPIAHSVQQAGSLEHTDLDLSHIQPKGVLRGGAKLDMPQPPYSAIFCREQNFIEGSRDTSVEIVLHNAGILCVQTDRVRWPADVFGIIMSGSSFRHFHIALLSQGFDYEEQIGGTQTLVVIANAFGLPRSEKLQRVHRRRWPPISYQSQPSDSVDHTPFHRGAVYSPP